MGNNKKGIAFEGEITPEGGNPCEGETVPPVGNYPLGMTENDAKELFSKTPDDIAAEKARVEQFMEQLN